MGNKEKVVWSVGLVLISLIWSFNFSMIAGWLTILAADTQAYAFQFFAFLILVVGFTLTAGIWKRRG